MKKSSKLRKNKIDKNILFIRVIRIIFLLEFAFAVISKLIWGGDYNYLNGAVALLSFALTYIPEAVAKLTKNRLTFSQKMKVSIVLFIFLTEFLGELKDFYYRISWWDDLMHLTSGVILALIGFHLAYALNKTTKKVNLSPFFVALFAFMFATMCGTLWEIFEFATDRLTGGDMQKYLPPSGTIELITSKWRYDAGLIDTMTDLIADTMTALGVSVWGYIVLKKEQKKMQKKS